MSLRDHFQPPLSDARRWNSFFTTWAVTLKGWLNCGVLPDGYFAEVRLAYADRNARDVAALAAPAWAAPPAAFDMPLVFTDAVEVRLLRKEGGRRLVAAVLLILTPREMHRLPLRAARGFALDSTGLKVFGEGEWKVREHGDSERRTWRKLHLAIHAGTQEVVACATTEDSVTDAEAVPELLDEIPGEVGEVKADGAYDRRRGYRAAGARGARPVIPPRRGAVIRKHGNASGPRDPRDENIRGVRRRGRAGWKEGSGYHERSLAETGMFRVKTVFGEKLRHRGVGVPAGGVSDRVPGHESDDPTRSVIPRRVTRGTGAWGRCALAVTQQRPSAQSILTLPQPEAEQHRCAKPHGCKHVGPAIRAGCRASHTTSQTPRGRFGPGGFARHPFPCS